MRAGQSASNALCAILESYLFASSSPLFDKLVRQDQHLEALSTWWWPHKDPSLFPIYFRLREGKARGPVLDAIQAALDEIAAVEARLSTWRTDSELSRANAAAAGGSVGLSPALALFIMTWDNILNVFIQPWVGQKSCG